MKIVAACWNSDSGGGWWSVTCNPTLEIDVKNQTYTLKNIGASDYFSCQGQNQIYINEMKVTSITFE